jgi:hypothetical protein
MEGSPSRRRHDTVDPHGGRIAPPRRDGRDGSHGIMMRSAILRTGDRVRVRSKEEILPLRPLRLAAEVS